METELFSFWPLFIDMLYIAAGLMLLICFTQGILIAARVL